MDFITAGIKFYFAGMNQFYDPIMIALCLIGTVIGIVIGALPGMTSTMGLAIFTPLTFGMDPNKAIVFLIGIYQGSVYGGSISAVLINIPGTPAAIATTLDGYPMGQRGEAGMAIGYATIASALGGWIGIIILTFAAPALAQVALMFSAEEYTALMVMALVVSSCISKEALFWGFISMVLGLFLGSIGQDPITAFPRFAFGSTDLYSGLEMISVMIGLFGLTEIFVHIDSKMGFQVKQKLGNMIPKLSEFVRMWALIIRSSIVGVFIGAAPMAAASIASITAYGMEKNLSKHPEKFGKGIPDGIVAPETANNASVGGAFIPMLTLGIPGDPMTAVLLGALILHGRKVGPLLFKTHPDYISSILVGNTLSIILFVILGLLCARLFAKAITVPYYILSPMIVIFCMVGSYAIRNSIFDVGVTIFFGLLGYGMRKINFPVFPLIMGMVLGPLLEENFRRTLVLTGGTLITLFTRPISLGLLIFTFLYVVIPWVWGWYKGRTKEV